MAHSGAVKILLGQMSALSVKASPRWGPEGNRAPLSSECGGDVAGQVAGALSEGLRRPGPAGGVTGASHTPRSVRHRPWRVADAGVRGTALGDRLRDPRRGEGAASGPWCG